MSREHGQSAILHGLSIGVRDSFVTSGPLRVVRVVTRTAVGGMERFVLRLVSEQQALKLTVVDKRVVETSLLFDVMRRHYDSLSLSLAGVR